MDREHVLENRAVVVRGQKSVALGQPTGTGYRRTPCRSMATGRRRTGFVGELTIEHGTLAFNDRPGFS